MIKLKDRIASYSDISDYKIIPKLPLIININGKNFSKLTELLEKPFCNKFKECILSTTIKLCHELEGCVFAYQHNDEISLILKNDQNVDTTPWLDNKIQKINSVSASIASTHFNKCSNALDLNILSEPLFCVNVFAVPNTTEAINYIIFKQQQNFHTSMQLCCFYELLKNKFDKNVIKEMLSGLSVDDKILLLKQECDIDFNEYSNIFKRGAACYKYSKTINENVKNKWHINIDLPIFTKDQLFLINIIK